MAIEDRLDVSQKTHRSITPRWQQRSRRWQRGSQRVGTGTWRHAARFVATGAGTLLAGLETDETSHAPQLHAVLIQQLKVHCRVRGDSEVCAPVRFHRDIAKYADRRPIDQRGTLLSVALSAELIVVGPANRFGDAHVMYAFRHQIFTPETHVAHHTRRVIACQIDRFGQYRRSLASAKWNGSETGNGRVAIDQFLGSEHIDEIESIAHGVRGLVAVRVGDKEELVGQWPGRGVKPAVIQHTSFGHRHAIHAALRRRYALRDDSDALRCVDARGGIHDHERSDRQRVVAGGDRDEFCAAGDRTCVFERPGIDEVLLEDGIGARAIRPHRPDRLNVGPAALVVLPTRVSDESVVQRVGQVIAVLVHAEPADPAAVRPHHVQIAARFVFVVFIALQRRAATLGHKHDVAVGSIRGVEVAPLARGQLTQSPPIHTDLKDVRGFLRAPQTITLRAIEPALRRLVAARHGISKHDARPVPVQVHAVHMTGTERG